jgi:endonuclease YncB( thermonuclease family)
MKRLFARAFAIAAGLVGSMLSAPITAGELQSVNPKRVIDGDTFYVSIRLFGVDAPEQGDRTKCDQEREWAMRAKCLDCSGGSRQEVRLCPHD